MGIIAIKGMGQEGQASIGQAKQGRYQLQKAER